MAAATTNKSANRASTGKGKKGGHNRNGERAAGLPGDNTVAVTVPVNSGQSQSGTASPAGQARELALSSVQAPHTLRKRTVINDSALRAFTLKSTVPLLIKNKSGLHIKRNWQFGLMVAPDFTSVNSLAGDKPGSSIGLTVDYQFANHWYIGTGILTTRKNYAARGQDYHVPQDFYQNIGIRAGDVSFVKGSLYMMEIPLNLRYDFSVAGNTLFFISGGVSSYLLTNENANLYWNYFNREWCKPVDHPVIKSTYLCSAIKLSAGVETGLSNSLSLLVAPYIELPAKSMGLGQVQMNSVGINFALKFAPVTSRKRQR